MLRAKAELGPGTVILENRTVRAPGLRGWLGRREVEVAALVGLPEATPAPPPPPAEASPELGGLIARVRGLGALLEAQGARPPRAQDLTPAARTAVRRLTAQNVPEAVAVEIITRAQSARRPGESLVQSLVRELDGILQPTAPLRIQRGGCRVVALIGPTGVGKTTTLAKLAAQYSIRGRLKVGVVGADSYRVGAGDQLRTYAQIMGLPMREADSPAGAAAAVAELHACDLVLVDTPGRSFREPGAISELQDLLSAIQPEEVHLVLALNTAPAQALGVLQAYGAAGPNRLLFTKLDETTGPGVIAAVRSRVPWPVSFVTTGQMVPEDILPADRFEFGRALLGA